MVDLTRPIKFASAITKLPNVQHALSDYFHGLLNDAASLHFYCQSVNPSQELYDADAQTVYVGLQGILKRDSAEAQDRIFLQLLTAYSFKGDEVVGLGLRLMAIPRLEEGQPAVLELPFNFTRWGGAAAPIPRNAVATAIVMGTRDKTKQLEEDWFCEWLKDAILSQFPVVNVV